MPEDYGKASPAAPVSTTPHLKKPKGSHMLTPSHPHTLTFYDLYSLTISLLHLILLTPSPHHSPTTSLYHSHTSSPLHLRLFTPSPAPVQLAQQPDDLPEGMYRCEFCGHVDNKAKFLPPSRRFCSLTCCKRWVETLSHTLPPLPPSFYPSLFPCFPSSKFLPPCLPPSLPPSLPPFSPSLSLPTLSTIHARPSFSHVFLQV